MKKASAFGGKIILIMPVKFKTKSSCIKHFHVNIKKNIKKKLKKKKEKKERRTVTTTNEDTIWCIFFIPLNL